MLFSHRSIPLRAPISAYMYVNWLRAIGGKDRGVSGGASNKLCISHPFSSREEAGILSEVRKGSRGGKTKFMVGCLVSLAHIVMALVSLASRKKSRLGACNNPFYIANTLLNIGVNDAVTILSL